METSLNVRTVENDVVLKSLIGGTLVKYEVGTPFALEFSRRSIQYGCYSDFGGFMLETDGPGRLEIRDTAEYEAKEIDGVLYLTGKGIYASCSFAIAPRVSKYPFPRPLEQPFTITPKNSPPRPTLGAFLFVKTSKNLSKLLQYRW